MSWSNGTEKDLVRIRRFGDEGWPRCLAKTRKSPANDPKTLGRPEGFEISVRNIILAAGARYPAPLLGDLLRMPAFRRLRRPSGWTRSTAASPA